MCTHRALFALAGVALARTPAEPRRDVDLMSKVVAPKAIAASLSEFWSPKVVGSVEDSFIKVAKVKGELAWHAHEHEDEVFYILKGRLRIEIEDSPAVELGEGEMYVVPKGVRHNPIADEECHILLIERKTTQHMGEDTDERTRSVEDQLSGARHSEL